MATLEAYADFNEALAVALSTAPPFCLLCDKPATRAYILTVPEVQVITPIVLCARCCRRVKNKPALRAKIEQLVLSHIELADTQAGRPC
jgi:hypothetical protein